MSTITSALPSEKGISIFSGTTPSLPISFLRSQGRG
jgi:hypothetical protein